MKELFFTNTALKDFKKLDQTTRRKIKLTLEKFRQEEKEPLSLAGAWKNWYKIRLGNYRILLIKTGNKWIVGYIRHRREAYRDRK